MNEYQSNTGNVIEVQQLEMFFAKVDAGLSMVSGPGDTSMICTTLPHIKVAPGMMKAMSATMGMVEKIFPVPANYCAEYCVTAQV